MKKIGFAILGITAAAVLTMPVMAEEGADKKVEKKAVKVEFFKKADTNADGKISPEEFKAAGESDKKFKAADTDKDGFLTAEELKAAKAAKQAKKGKGENPPKEAAK